ncbi:MULTISPECIES: glycosyltransferase family 2 protein [Hyphobacterium]|uniref:Glycosyltransferase family 2 protein n=1 Tax=Hyphobacterium vulgare TaxID=1736751 RepID=A0ABV6ZYW1_9PROT
MAASSATSPDTEIALDVPSGRVRIEVSNRHGGPVHLGLQVFDSDSGALAALIPMRMEAGESRRINGLPCPGAIRIVPLVTPAGARLNFRVEACAAMYAGLRDLARVIGLEGAKRPARSRATLATPRWLDPAPTLKTGTKISVIIPTRDRLDLLKQAIATAFDAAQWPDRELVVVDNGSVEADTLAYLKGLDARSDAIVVRDGGDFNFSRLINSGTSAATGDVFVLLNNDVIGGDPRWLGRLAAWAMKRGIGAAGALLTYPDGTIQHAGIKVGVHGLTDHVMTRHRVKGPYTERARRIDAVTGACLATSRKVFEALGGFEENFAVEMSDVDYCLRAERAGLINVFEPAARLGHLESQSRGAPSPRVLEDRAEFIRVWGERLLKGAR